MAAAAAARWHSALSDALTTRRGGVRGRIKIKKRKKNKKREGALMKTQRIGASPNVTVMPSKLPELSDMTGGPACCYSLSCDATPPLLAAPFQKQEAVSAG